MLLLISTIQSDHQAEGGTSAMSLVNIDIHLKAYNSINQKVSRCVLKTACIVDCADFKILLVCSALTAKLFAMYF